MEENILELYVELDNVKSEKSTMDFSLRRLLKIRKFFEKIAKHHIMDHQMLTEIISLKARIVKNTDEHKIAMFQNTKTVKSIVKMHKETVKFMDNY